MISWDANLEGRTVVLDLVVDGRTASIPLSLEEADEMAQRLVELVIEGDIDGIPLDNESSWSADDDEGEDALLSWYDDDEDDAA